MRALDRVVYITEKLVRQHAQNATLGLFKFHGSAKHIWTKTLWKR